MNIVLPSGHTVKIDEEDFNRVSQYKWHIQAGYAKTEMGDRRLGTRRHLAMHRLITKAQKGQVVDHINMDKLDNRKSNLRFCDKSTNGMNRVAQSNSKTGVKGVCWSKQKRRWRVTVNCNRKQYHIGFFKELGDAKEASRFATNLIHKQFARI